jgi:hypothetical protein
MTTKTKATPKTEKTEPKILTSKREKEVAK